MAAAGPAIELERAVKLIRMASNAVALTGAGISTPSGIPDFRSPDTGLWEQYDPMQVASLTAFRYNPGGFFDWFHELALKLISAEPNAAHHALARLERLGLLRGVITQNIDGLHQKAGSQNVLEIHGTLRTATCISCYHRYATDPFIEEYLASRKVPRCTSCGAVLKPDVILFGEQLPFKEVLEARKWIASCDLVLVIGSSLTVDPVAHLPFDALSHGARLVIVNHEPTYLDRRADAVFHQDLAEVLPRIVTEVRGE